MFAWLKRHGGFAAALLAGFAIAFIYTFLLLIGECLPRDDEAALRACHAMKNRDLWLYPALSMLAGSAAIWFHVNRKSGAVLLALTHGILAAVGLGLVNALV